MPIDDYFGIQLPICLFTSQPSCLYNRRRPGENLFDIFRRNTNISLLALVRDCRFCKCLRPLRAFIVILALKTRVNVFGRCSIDQSRANWLIFGTLVGNAVQYFW